MSCEDVRRLALAGGGAAHTELRKHAAGCASCRRFLEELVRENEVLRDALAIEVPPGLADRILIQLAPPRARAARGSRWAAGAALVTFACWLGWQMSVSRGLVTAMLEHVLEEPSALEAQGALPAEQLTAVLSRAGVFPRLPLGRLRYAADCHLLGGSGHHFVVDGPYGAATIIVGPPGATLLFSSAAARDGYYGEVLSGRGVTVGVIGPDREAVAALAATLQRG